MTRNPGGDRQSGSPIPASMMFSLASSLLRRPDLWFTAVRSYRDLVPSQWWRERPRLPVPHAPWVNFRLVTAYGGEGLPSTESGSDTGSASSYSGVSDDFVVWLEWLRDVKQLSASSNL